MASCESCGPRNEATHLIDFRDLGPVFLVCRPCAQEAADWGASVSSLDVSTPVIPGQQTLPFDEAS